jgi:predicted deacylase
MTPVAALNLKRRTLVWVAILGLAAAAEVLGQAPGPIAGLKLTPGTIVDGKIDIAAGSDAATEIPVTVVVGTKPGPTLAVLAGFAGTDYGPIAATFELLKELKPAEMRGTLVIVHIANVPAFLDRSIYLNPIDRKDLTLTFPGKADGTSSERIAHAITTEVIDKADFVIVLEAGGTNMMLAPFVYQVVTGEAKLDAKIAEMALGFGINYIIVSSDPKRPKDPAQSVTPENTGLTRGKPTVKVACGSFGIADNRTIGAMTRGISSLMNLFELTAGNVAKTRVPVFIDHTVVVESPANGVLSPYIQRGQNVHKDEPLFGISNFMNKNQIVIRAGGDGIVLAIMSTPPVRKGDIVALIGIPRPGQ